MYEDQRMFQVFSHAYVSRIDETTFSITIRRNGHNKFIVDIRDICVDPAFYSCFFFEKSTFIFVVIANKIYRLYDYNEIYSPEICYISEYNITSVKHVISTRFDAFGCCTSIIILLENGDVLYHNLKFNKLDLFLESNQILSLQCMESEPGWKSFIFVKMDLPEKIIQIESSESSLCMLSSSGKIYSNVKFCSSANPLPKLKIKQIKLFFNNFDSIMYLMSDDNWYINKFIACDDSTSITKVLFPQQVVDLWSTYYGLFMKTSDEKIYQSSCVTKIIHHISSLDGMDVRCIIADHWSDIFIVTDDHVYMLQGANSTSTPIIIEFDTGISKLYTPSIGNGTKSANFI